MANTLCLKIRLPEPIRQAATHAAQQAGIPLATWLTLSVIDRLESAGVDTSGFAPSVRGRPKRGKQG